MGRTKVRMYLRTTDAQAVWKEYSEYMTTASKGASERRKLTQYVTNTVLPHAIRPRTLKNPNQRHVATGGEEDHQPHSKTLKQLTSSMDDGKSTMPDQRLVAAGGEEDHQPHPKPLKHPISSTDVGTPTSQIKGLLQLERRKIIILTPKPLNFQLLLQMLVCQLSQIKCWLKLEGRKIISLTLKP